MKKSDITFNSDDLIFNYRIAGVIRKGNKILVQQDNRSLHYTLPGGRCSFMEDSKLTLQREIEEEIGYKVKFVKDISFLENFFISSFNGKQYHELLIVLEIYFENEDIYGLESIPCIEEHKKDFFTFTWIDIDELRQKNFKPEALLDSIQNENFDHIILSEIS